MIIGTGLRKGEALGLHWADVHLDEHLLFVRYTLTNINNTTPVLTAPKTKSSYGWIGLSDRVANALRRQADRQRRQRRTQPVAGDHGLVFTRPNGQPLRPEYVLHRLHRLGADARLPHIRVHYSATLPRPSCCPPRSRWPWPPRPCGHATLSTTVNIYEHLQPNVAHDAVEAIATALRNAAPGVGPSPPKQWRTLRQYRTRK